MKPWLILAVAVAAGLLVGSAMLYTSQKSSAYNSPSCEVIGIGWRSVNHQTGLTYLCGRGTVSDGRLSMTLNNYRFASGNSLQWTCPSNNLNGTDCSTSGVFLLANITVANIGKGNTSIGPSLYANVTNGGEFVGNGEEGMNIFFQGQYPNSSIPSTNGGAFLPPGKSITYWFLFWLPNTGLGDLSNLKLNNISFVESVYGGDWEGDGGFRCPCQSPMVDLIVA